MHGQFRGNTAEGAKAKLLLLNPPSGLYRRDDRCQSRVEDQSVRVVLPPIDLAQYAAVARQAGAEPFIADYPAMGADWRRGANYVQQEVSTSEARAEPMAIRKCSVGLAFLLAE